jgi:osmotically-inducible protein OsmY
MKTNSISWPLAVGLGALGLGLAEPAAVARVGEESAPPNVAEQAAIPSDPSLTRAVQDAVHSDRQLKKVNATADPQGKVTLIGTVDTQSQKEHATNIAEGVKGVSTVDNKLAVGPGNPTGTAKQALRETGQAASDSWITTKVKSQFLATWTGIHVTTENGVVTLSGTAASEADRAKAVDIAKTTTGVTKVVDAIHVAPK